MGIALGDCPAGLYAWISEKLFLWTDNKGNLENVFTKEELLTWISVYWHTKTINTSFSPYIDGLRMNPLGKKILVPTVFSVIRKDVALPKKSIAKPFYKNLIYFEEGLPGGHFAAWENPIEYFRVLKIALNYEG